MSGMSFMGSGGAGNLAGGMMSGSSRTATDPFGAGAFAQKLPQLKFGMLSNMLSGGGGVPGAATGNFAYRSPAASGGGAGGMGGGFGGGFSSMGFAGAGKIDPEDMIRNERAHMQSAAQGQGTALTTALGHGGFGSSAYSPRAIQGQAQIKSAENVGEGDMATNARLNAAKMNAQNSLQGAQIAQQGSLGQQGLNEQHQQDQQRNALARAQMAQDWQKSILAMAMNT